MSPNMSPNENPPAPPDPAKRRRLILVAVGLMAVALFMYVSFMVKTATMGP